LRWKIHSIVKVFQVLSIHELMDHTQYAKEKVVYEKMQTSVINDNRKGHIQGSILWL
jgi:hypothetical protein